MAKRSDRRLRGSDAPADTPTTDSESTSRSGSLRHSPSKERPKHSKADTLANDGLTDKTRRRRKKSTMGSIVELVVIIAIALGLALGIQQWIVKPYKIPSGSMEPTLIEGQRVLVDRIGTHFSKPHIGQITVFHPPAGAKNEQCGPITGHTITFGKSEAACDLTNTHPESDNFIKRVVAGPGDEIYIQEGHAYLKEPGKSKFVKEHDPYIKECGEVQECNFTKPIKIPPGHWFMMGDNRGESDDSRFWGPVPTSWIIGAAFFTYWPPDRFGTF